MARTKALAATDPLRRWTTQDALETYNIQGWGCGYFGINSGGDMIVTPRAPDGRIVNRVYFILARVAGGQRQDPHRASGQG